LIFVTVNIDLTILPDLVPEQIKAECKLRDVIYSFGVIEVILDFQSIYKLSSKNIAKFRLH
jgi:hypothetical protein